MAVTWVWAVRGLMKSASPISGLERPATRSASTSRSRGVRPYGDGWGVGVVAAAIAAGNDSAKRTASSPGHPATRLDGPAEGLVAERSLKRGDRRRPITEDDCRFQEFGRIAQRLRGPDQPGRLGRQPGRRGDASETDQPGGGRLGVARLPVQPDPVAVELGGLDQVALGRGDLTEVDRRDAHPPFVDPLPPDGQRLLHRRPRPLGVPEVESCPAQRDEEHRHRVLGDRQLGQERREDRARFLVQGDGTLQVPFVRGRPTQRGEQPVFPESAAGRAGEGEAGLGMAPGVGDVPIAQGERTGRVANLGL